MDDIIVEDVPIEENVEEQIPRDEVTEQDFQNYCGIDDRIAEIDRKNCVVGMHESVHMFLAIISGLLSLIFFITLIVAFTTTAENETLKWSSVGLFIFFFILTPVFTFTVNMLKKKGKFTPKFYDLYYKKFLYEFRQPIESFEKVSMFNRRRRSSSNSTLAENVGFQEIRNPVVLSARELQRQFEDDGNPFEPAVPIFQIAANEQTQTLADINLQYIDCSESSASAGDSPGTLSTHLTSAVTPDRIVPGPSLVARQTSTLSDISKVSPDSPVLSLGAPEENLGNVQQQASSADTPRSEMSLPGQVPDF